MANTFTALAPVAYSIAQTVSQEPSAVLNSIRLDFDAKNVAVGDTVYVPVAPVRTVSTYTPAMTTTAGTDAVASSVGVSITNRDYADWNMTGEQIRSLRNGTINEEWMRQIIQQAMRAIRNNAEIVAAVAVKLGASRAVGTAGTTPFASNLDVMVDARKVLRDNGAPMVDLQLVTDTAANVNLLKQGIIQQAYQAGSDEERRSGMSKPQFGFQISDSAGIALHTKGTGAAYATSGSTAVGVRDIALVTGTGTVLAGDVVTFAADAANKYVVGTGVAAPGTISLNRPGARVVIATANALTVGNNYTANLAFERSAVVGVMRAPEIPLGGQVTGVMPISDAQGMTYTLVEITGDGMITYRLHLNYGFKVVQPEHVALIMG